MAEQTNIALDTMPNAVPQVPADWAVIGAKSGYDPKPAEALRIFVVGPSGEGKTTLASSIPGTLILDFDEGAEAIPGSVATRIAIRDYNHFDVVINKLLAGHKAGKNPFGRVGIDTVDECISMIKHRLEDEKKVEDITDYRSEGYGYNLILQRFWSKILDIEQAGCSWVILGHMRTKTEVDPVTKKPVTRVRESVYPGVAKKILTKADFKLTVYGLEQSIKQEKVKKILSDGRQIELPPAYETKRVYYINSMSTEKGDNKSRGVPSMERKFEIPLIGGWSVFKEKYDNAVKIEREKESKRPIQKS